MESQNINWKSPALWPMIDQAVKEQKGKPNLSEVIRTLKDRDRRFEHLTHQRLSDWRDKTQANKLSGQRKLFWKFKGDFSQVVTKHVSMYL